MARIFFMAFDKAGQTPLIKKLRAAGHRLAISEPRYPEFFNLARQQLPPPQVFVIDASTQASHAREAGNYLKSLKAFRDTPFLVFNVKKDDQAPTLEKIPGALLLPDDSVEKALGTLGLGPSTAA